MRTDSGDERQYLVCLAEVLGVFSGVWTILRNEEVIERIANRLGYIAQYGLCVNEHGPIRRGDEI